jgi:ribonucleoside-triphosphate reductase
MSEIPAAPSGAPAPEAAKAAPAPAAAAPAPETAAPAPRAEAAPAQTVIGENAILLFKTPTCPNCKAAGMLLDKAGVEYMPLNANEEKDLVARFDVKQAPTLVLVNGESFEKYRGVSDIKGWLMKK